MCRNLTARIKAIEEARAKSPYVVEVYDTYDDGINLTQLIVVDDMSTGRIYDVTRDGSLEHRKTVPWYDDRDSISKYRIAAMLDNDPHFIRIVG